MTMFSELKVLDDFLEAKMNKTCNQNRLMQRLGVACLQFCENPSPKNFGQIVLAAYRVGRPHAPSAYAMTVGIKEAIAVFLSRRWTWDLAKNDFVVKDEFLVEECEVPTSTPSAKLPKTRVAEYGQYRLYLDGSKYIVSRKFKDFAHKTCEVPVAVFLLDSGSDILNDKFNGPNCSEAMAFFAQAMDECINKAGQLLCSEYRVGDQAPDKPLDSTTQTTQGTE